MIYAFDADVLIYAAAGNALGLKVRTLLLEPSLDTQRFGSVLLLPELFIKPSRGKNESEVQALKVAVSRLELVEASEEVAVLALSLGVNYGLKALDALHLASAVHIGADRFLTNNKKDFKKAQMLELEIIHPEEL